MISYCTETKKYLLETQDKKKCCSRMFGDISALAGHDSSEQRLEVIRKAPEHFKCPGCFQAFLRGMFIVYGNVTDPSKRYHLELSFPTSEERDTVSVIIADNGFDMSPGERRGRYLLYIKSSTKIEDFFALIGANKSVFDLMNSKIVKDLNSQTNRQLNCDMANIRKILTSAQPYIDAINELQNNGGIVRLPADLKQTAKLRTEFPQASMSDLALMHEPPISKSGVKHRLDKIMDIAENFKK